MQIPKTKHEWPLPIRRDDIAVEMISIATLVQRQAEWSVLAAHSLEPNPFLSPAFLLPLIASDMMPDGIQALVLSRENGSGSEMLGMALVRPKRKLSWRLGGRRAYRTLEIWRHPSQPFGGMLLAGDPASAARALSRMFDWLCGPKGAFDTLEFAALVAGSRLATLLTTFADEKRLIADKLQREATTRGLNFLPTYGDVSTGHFRVESAVVPAAQLLERLLADEMTITAEPTVAPLLSDVGATAFARAMVRGLAAEGRLIVARSVEDGANAIGAIAMIGTEQTVIWRVMGRGLGNPEAEASMVAAIRSHHDKPAVVGMGQTMTGIGLAQQTLCDLKIKGFDAAAPSEEVARRLAPLAPAPQSAALHPAE